MRQILSSITRLKVSNYLTTDKALRHRIAEFANIYNASWLRECYGHKTLNQVRAEQKPLVSEAATEFKLAA
jgi:hypothetical protein